MLVRDLSILLRLVIATIITSEVSCTGGIDQTTTKETLVPLDIGAFLKIPKPRNRDDGETGLAEQRIRKGWNVGE